MTCPNCGGTEFVRASLFTTAQTSVLEVAARYPAFPMLLETTRECLRDVFDLPALRAVGAFVLPGRLQAG